MALLRLSLSVLLFAMLIFCNRAIAASLEDINFSALPGGRFEASIKFSAPAIKPQGYTIENPARIVLDFADVDNRLTQKQFPLSFDNAQNAVVLSSGGRTRLTIHLSKPAAYSTEIKGDTLVVTVDAPSAAAVSKYGRQVKAQQTFGADDENAIKDIDFRRGENGEGRVLLKLGSAKTKIDVEETASGIIVNFLNTRIADALRRRLDVNDFATPVKIIAADAEGDNAVVIVQVEGDFDYLAYQADNNYVLSVKPLTPSQVEEKKARFAFVGEKLSLNFQDIPVRSVLQIIADFTDLNLVASDTVDGRITLRLENVPWDQALDIVLKTKGLDKRQIGNVLMIAPAAEIAERERQELETRQQLQELAPLRTEYIRVKYANATELFNLFNNEEDEEDESSTGSILSERGSAIVDERTNSIILTETEDKINEFKQLIEKIDIPVRQVMVESRIVVASTDFRRELGMTINGAVNGTPGNSTVDTSGSVNLGAGADTTSALALDILADDILLGLELTAMESNNFAEVISQPKVITGDKQQATIAAGTEIPYISSDGDTVTTVFREAVLKLDVTPQITPDNRIIMALKINNDSRGEDVPGFGGDVPTIDTTELNTRVLVGNGQTIVLGGIFTQTESNTISKVPLLGDIPLIGRLFRNDLNQNDKREILIFITPRILSENLID